MFGGKKINELQARLEQVEAQIDERIEQSLEGLRLEIKAEMRRALTRLERDPSKRLALLVEGIEQTLGERVTNLGPRLDEAERDLQRADGILASVRSHERTAPEFGVDHEAHQTGLLTLYAVGGWNDKARVSIDGELVGTVNTINDMNGSLAVVVRRGERYRINSESMEKRGETGIRTLFTPFAP